jgi:crossover junction endodeoxyribonuclease RuvC
MRIVGIDCGAERTGFGVIDSDGRTHRLITAGVIRTNPAHALERRLKLIAAELREVFQTFGPQAAAVEEVFYAVNAKSALKLAHVRGVALLQAAEAGLAVAEYSPLEVKMSVVGYGRAEKQQVQMMVHSLLRVTEPFASYDVSDALAVAICHGTRANLLAIAGGAPR